MRLHPPHTLPMRASNAARCALVFLLVLAFVLLTGLLDGGVGVGPLRLFAQPVFPLANALPGLLLAGILLVATRRAVFAFGLAFTLQGAVYAVNALKVGNLGTPLMPVDFHMVGQLRRGGFHVLSGYLPQSPWVYLALVAVLGMIVALWRWEPPLLARRTHGKRILSGSVLMLALASVLAGSSLWNRVYNGRVLWLEPWSAAATSNHSGLLSSLMMFHLQFAQAKAKPDRVAAQQLIDQFDPQLRHIAQLPPVTTELPDIVVVQSESFFDPRTLRGYEHSNLTPNLHRLAAHGISGKLHVPTFGGGTIRTEFEVLTGLSLRYFDNLQFPYLQMNHTQVPSLVRELNVHGYETIALHGNDPAFWNRTMAFKALGFDRFVSRSAFPPDALNDGKYMADSAMTDAIMAQLKASGPPQFIFAISIEAHGPYDVEPAQLAARDAIVVPAGVTGKNQRELQTYLYHLARADAELGRLVHRLASRKRPSLVLFYGDHLPALSDTYATTGFVDGRNMLSQASVWLLVDPHDIRRAPTRVDTAAWLLPGKLLTQLSLHDDRYFALTELAGASLAALTEAPGATLPVEDVTTHALDRRMSSVSQLRMAGKLDQLLPDPTPQAGAGIAHEAKAPPAQRLAPSQLP